MSIVEDIAVVDGEDAAASDDGGSPYTSIIFVLACAVLVMLLSWIIPAGSYDKDAVGNMIPGTFHVVPSSPIGLWEFMLSLFGGLQDATNLILYLMAIGSLFSVMEHAGVWNSLVARAGMFIRRGKIVPVIIAVMVVISIMSSVLGIWEELMCVIPFLSSSLVLAGYASIYSLAAGVLAVMAGAMGGMINPFSVGIASDQLDISVADGLLPRAVMFVVLVAFNMAYVVYKVRQNSEDITEVANSDGDALDGGALSAWQMRALYVCCIVPVLIVVMAMLPWDTMGAVFHLRIKEYINYIPIMGNVPVLGDWGFLDYSIVFCIFGMLASFIAGFPFGRYIDILLSSVKDMLGVSMVITIGMGIKSMMISSNIMWTMVHYLEVGLVGYSSSVFILVCLLFLMFMTVMLPTSTGLAVSVIPLLGNTALLLGFESSIVVTLLQIAYPFISAISPGSPVLIALLGLNKTSFNKWFEFAVVPVVISGVLATLILMIMA